MSSPDVPPPIDGSSPAQPSPAPQDPRAQLGPDGRPPGLLDTLIKARATCAFLIAVALIFFLEWRDPGTSTLQLPFAPSVYSKFGGFDYELVQQGQYWRYLSALFVPRFAVDAFVYLFIFIQLGPGLEKMLGTTRFCVLYLGAGVAGVAVGHIVSPQAGTFGTVLVVYALLGGIPGVILGMTGSVARTVADPNARSAAFWLLFWILLGAFFGRNAGWGLAGGLTAAAMAMAFGATLGSWRRAPGRAAALTGLPLLLVIASVGLDVAGYRYLDGRLIRRDAIKPGGVGESPAPVLPGTGGEPEIPRTEPERLEKAADQASPLREKWEPLLDRFGALPVLEAVTEADDPKLQECLFELDEAVRDPSSSILGELDDLRVRCMVLLGRHDAPSVADQHLDYAPSPAARALAGVAYYYRAGDQAGDDARTAERYLDSALERSPSLAAEQPEAVWFRAALLYKRREDARANEGFRRYLELVGEDELSAPAYRRPLILQAKTQLGR